MSELSSYPHVHEDLQVIKTAFSGCPHSPWFFLDNRFLQGVLAGIILFYVVLYYTRRYKNRVIIPPNDNTFTYATSNGQMSFTNDGRTYC
ncbi:conserved Plasmodium protein, unknown function [Plasmodium malariae]|uniref:Uncharacterized protein n=1 Tax=Plasmodium malariae TaxID=5858 RepID=A0A1C3KKZ4_PLAMA|nr:conserved Plasmodium protein, unknown function [Plasmodium malariae]